MLCNKKRNRYGSSFTVLYNHCLYFSLLSSSPYSVRTSVAFDSCVWINNHPGGVWGEGQGEGQGWPLSAGGKKG